MKHLNGRLIKIISITSFTFSTIFLSSSAYRWLSEPNNFLYIKESKGYWSPQARSDYRASGYKVKINADCAEKIYNQIEKTALKDLNQKKSSVNITVNDFKRFMKNKNIDVDFQSAEIDYISRFKWFKNDYITYDDPSLKSGIRFSFSNKCLYEKDCLLSDCINYLFIKIGIKYFINTAQAEYLKDNCIENQKVFYSLDNKYNFGRSDIYYRNGIGIWLGIWYNLLGIFILILSMGALFFVFKKKNPK